MTRCAFLRVKALILLSNLLTKSAVETIFKVYFVVFLFATQSSAEIRTSLKFETFDENNLRQEIKPLRDSILCDIADSKREREEEKFFERKRKIEKRKKKKESIDLRFWLKQ